jgi:hypothetical protein
MTCEKQIGCKVDVMNIAGSWTSGIIVELNVSQEMKIEYYMCGELCSEWIDCISNRIAVFGCKTYQPNISNLELGHNIEALDLNGKWYESIVVDVKNELVKLHYHGRNSHFDEWLPKDSIRIRKYAGTSVI